MNTILPTIRIKQYGQSAYGSRHTGNRIRQHVLDVIDTANGPVVLDFDGIDFVAPGFADELIGVLVYHSGKAWSDEHVHLVNLDGEVAEEVHQAIAARQRLRDRKLAAHAA